MMQHGTPDPGLVLQAAWQVLTDEGRLAFSIVHPVIGGQHIEEQVTRNPKLGTATRAPYFVVVTLCPA